MVFFELPGFAAVVRFLSLPVKRGRSYFAEGPANGHAIGIDAAKHDPVSLTPALCGHDVIVLRVDINNPPLLECSIEKPNRGADRPFFLVASGITDPEVLYRSPVHHPAKPDLAFVVGNASVVARKREIGVPHADQAIEGLSFFAK